MDHPFLDLFSNEVCIRIVQKITFKHGKDPGDYLLQPLFTEIFEDMDIARDDMQSLWCDYTVSAKEKLMGFVQANNAIDIYHLAVAKQEQEMYASIAANKNQQQVVRKEIISISQKNGEQEEDCGNRVPMSNRLASTKNHQNKRKKQN